MDKEKIAIVEDELIVAMDLEETVRRLGYEVCGTAGSPEEAMALIREERPSLVICDVNLNADIDGIDMLKELKKNIAFPVIFLTAFHDEKTINRALEVGASYYLVKPFAENQLKAALQIVLQQKKEPEMPLPSDISPRELEVIRLMVEGNKSPEIAEMLNNSYFTITTHTKNIRKKLGVKSNMDVVALAVKHKWV